MGNRSERSRGELAMEVHATITAATLAAGALIAQGSILAILFFGSLALRGAGAYHSFGWIILAFALLTMGPLFFAETFSTAWRPLFGIPGSGGLAHGTAMAVMFLLDILCVTILVARSGGSHASPFQAMYFLLPTLALFLREPYSRLVTYLVFVLLSFTLFSFEAPTEIFSPSLPHRDPYDQKWFSFAYWLVSVLCVLLATYIGYITRPR